MKTTISNRQKRHPLQKQNLRAMLLFLVSKASRHAADLPRTHVTLVLTDADGITEINDACFGKRHPTDVIACRYDALPGGMDTPSAELFVNVEQAVAKGRELARSRHTWFPSKELALYMAHGCDHLAGGSDATPHERARMRRRELGWLRDAEAQGILRPGALITD